VVDEPMQDRRASVPTATPKSDLPAPGMGPMPAPG
jgi:hypothetical protein